MHIYNYNYNYVCVCEVVFKCYDCRGRHNTLWQRIPGSIELGKKKSFEIERTLLEEELASSCE